MLGITVPDAIAIGTLVLACLAAYRGTTAGTSAKEQAVKAAPYVGLSNGIAGSIVDANQFGDYIKAIDKLAIAMTGHTAALNRQHEVKTTNALEELADKIDAMRDEKNRRR